MASALKRLLDGNGTQTAHGNRANQGERELNNIKHNKLLLTEQSATKDYNQDLTARQQWPRQ